MSRLTSFRRNLFRRGRVERDLDDELRAMFELLVEENVRAGMTGEEARRHARVELGNVETIKAHVRDARAGAWVDSLGRDFHHAARTLVKRPGVPLIIVDSPASAKPSPGAECFTAARRSDAAYGSG